MSGTERVLVSRHSAYNMILLTEDIEGLRTLRFGHEGACQSVINVDHPERLELPYARVLPACLSFVQNPRRVLVVGLGGGTIPSLFHRHLSDVAVDVVEIDEVVVEVAKDYCGFHEDERMRVYIDDGRDFIESRKGCYDMIILDSFDAESIPRHLTTSEFLQSVRRALTPDGIVVANVWGRAVNQLYDDMLLTYRHVFDDVYICDVPAPGTKIFVALPRKQAMSKDTLLQRCRAISRERGFHYDISSEVSGFRHSDDERLRGGAVLTDHL